MDAFDVGRVVIGFVQFRVHKTIVSIMGVNIFECVTYLTRSHLLASSGKYMWL